MRLAKYLVMAAVGLCLSNPIADAKNINVGWKLIGPSVSIICETVLAGKFSEVGRPSR